MKPRGYRQAVVLTHGLWLWGWCMGLVAWRLRRCGFDTYLFSYRSVKRRLRENALALREFSDSIEGSTVHFVGHSLGGVVIQTMLAHYPPPRPGRIVTLGSPHRGSYTARTVSRASAGRLILGVSIADLLNEPPVCDLSSREVGLVSGDLPIGLGRLFPGLPFPNDGVVALNETYLSGAKDEVTLHVSHTWMLFSARVARSICQFLRFGHFIR